MARTWFRKLSSKLTGNWISSTILDRLGPGSFELHIIGVSIFFGGEAFAKRLRLRLLQKLP
jgi:hypothetical protein